MRRLAGILPLTLLGAAAAMAQAPSFDAWTLLDRSRQALSDGAPLAATFTQEYQPAGFESVDRETGRVSLDLPSCARWDYDAPFEKSFLLCGAELYSWQPGEDTGLLYDLDAAAQPGLDLLLLDIGDLEARYEVSVEAMATEVQSIRLALTPRGEGSALTAASIDLERQGSRLLALSYRDREGNRTTFRFGPWKPAERLLLFAPPPDVVWELHR